MGAYQAKAHLSRLLEEVGRGERFTITEHRLAVALLLPVGRGHTGEWPRLWPNSGACARGSPWATKTRRS